MKTSFTIKKKLIKILKISPSIWMIKYKYTTKKYFDISNKKDK